MFIAVILMRHRYIDVQRAEFNDLFVVAKVFLNPLPIVHNLAFRTFLGIWNVIKRITKAFRFKGVKATVNAS